AERIGGTRWAAVFRVRAADPRAGPGRHDFLHMARRAARFMPRLAEPEIRITLEDAPESANVVVARVTGKDVIGLLAEPLRGFAGPRRRPPPFFAPGRGRPGGRPLLARAGPEPLREPAALGDGAARLPYAGADPGSTGSETPSRAPPIR